MQSGVKDMEEDKELEYGRVWCECKRKEWMEEDVE